MKRPKWDIDRLLDSLVGVDVRVAAKAFAPAREVGEHAARLNPVRALFLPDNSQADGLLVYFEGRLQKFTRQIGVVMVWLDAPSLAETALDGQIFFRGKSAIVVRGSAVVELAFPFEVERLPPDANNYWWDVRFPRAQFEFPFVGR